MTVTSHQNLITSRDIIIRISTKLRQFLVTSFSFIAQMHARTKSDTVPTQGIINNKLEPHMHHVEGNASPAGRLFTAQADGIFGPLRRAKCHVNT